MDDEDYLGAEVHPIRVPYLKPVLIRVVVFYNLRESLHPTFCPHEEPL